MKELIETYEKLIYSIVSKFNYYDKEDLYQVGCIGLLKAYENFDNTKECKFSTYAYSYILGEIKKYIREDNSLKISRDIARLSYKLDKIKDYLAQKYMKEPTVEEIAMYLEIPVKEVIEAIKLKKNHISLDSEIETVDGSVYLYESIASKKEDIDSLMDLDIALNSLENVEKQIITDRYFKDLTQMEVANTLSMSQVQVCRNEQKILKKLKQTLYQ